MRKTNADPSALKQATAPKLKDNLERANATLDRIQKNLEDYLETKRAAFPRFLFLSNDELLEILAEARNPQAVQPHLIKCFDNIKRLDFGDSSTSIDIFNMFSGEGEKVGLGKNLKARGNVETWLGKVEEHMFTSLRDLTKLAVQEYEEQVSSLRSLKVRIPLHPLANALGAGAHPLGENAHGPDRPHGGDDILG